MPFWLKNKMKPKTCNICFAYVCWFQTFSGLYYVVALGHLMDLSIMTMYMKKAQKIACFSANRTK
jgi:hypothetical protein